MLKSINLISWDVLTRIGNEEWCSFMLHEMMILLIMLTDVNFFHVKQVWYFARNHFFVSVIKLDN